MIRCRPVLVVGLTGGIGSGKSTVARLLAAKGAVVIDADALAREVVEPGTETFRRVVERFGPGVVAPDGTLDRPALARIVFADPEARRDLERITHPAIGALMAQRMAEQAATDNVVVLDVPLLVESGRSDVAGVIVVDCPEEVALERLVAQRGMDPDDARRRMAAQVGRAERLARADFVIDNAGSLAALEEQVERAWAWIEGLRQRKAAVPGKA
jgi:dephospho-CoA kinase